MLLLKKQTHNYSEHMIMIDHSLRFCNVPGDDRSRHLGFGQQLVKGLPGFPTR